MKKVVVELRNGVMFGVVEKVDGQNVYVNVDGTTYKFHQDQVTEIQDNKYYIVREKQNKQTGRIEISSVLPTTRSTRALGYKYIERNELPTLKAYHNLSEGIRYAGQWYYNCRKGNFVTSVLKGY
jgi:hypothetical protein